MDLGLSLEQSCKLHLSEKGRLSTAIPGFIARTSQSDLAVAIAKAINDKSILVAEAGTGTGKTFAYLLPSLLSGKKVLISTATKTLQDQLFQKDLPTLIRALGLATRIQNLKGRANYICHYRTNLYAEEGTTQTLSCAYEIGYVKDKLSQMHKGERSELPEIREESPVWPYVTSNTDNCLGQECPNQEDCFLIKARRRAMNSDVVVINHHLFFADSRLKQEGLGELLPQMDVVIFDEAHQVADIATHFNGQRIGTRQFQILLEDIQKEWPVLDLANQPLKTLTHQFDQIVNEFFSVLPLHEERISWSEAQIHPDFKKIWDQWGSLNDELNLCFDKENQDEIPGLTRCKERLEELQQLLSTFNQPNLDNILWIERFKQTLVFHATPYDITALFKKLLNKGLCTYVFTSATLTMANSFDCFCNSLGLEEAITLSLPSPFNYSEQALLYLPRSLPDPKDSLYYDKLLERTVPIINALQGRCFFLFTSHSALNNMARKLKKVLNYPLLVQGDEAKPILLERFRSLGNAILLGTSTFWEGVDVKGEALSCVIIDKLPFTSPADPVIRGRMNFLKKKGISPFDKLSLPDAVIALKQGVGRLIRDENDKGVLMIADPRLTARHYGKVIMASLPPLPKTRDEQKVLQFIRDLALNEELISD